jgi:signal transduction histidine kinase
MGVSRFGLASRIQTTPDIDRNKGGVAAMPGRLEPPIEDRTYRTWPVFSIALTVLLGLMLVPTLVALRRSQAIYAEIRATQQQYQTTQRVLQALSQNVFTMSLTIREFLLDSSPDAGRIYRSRLNDTRVQLQANVAQLGERMPSDGAVTLQMLQQDVNEYLAVVLSVFDWTPPQRAEQGVYFLREEQRPRRETILAVADRLVELNASAYAEQQRKTVESEQAFRRSLEQSVRFALVAGVFVSLAGILRMRLLERRALEQRKRAEAATEEMRSLSTRLRHAQEDERRAISRELHDDVGQKLTAMRMELAALERLRAAGDHEFETCLAEVKALAEQSLHVIRDIAAVLRPSVLDNLGLGAAIQKQARAFAKRTGLEVSVSVDEAGDRLDDRQRIYVYRIVQEALTNCARHSHASRVAIMLTGGDGIVDLTVADDGVGFDRAAVARAGLGLVGMEERVRELGGTMVLRSGHEGGTTIHVGIPR